nr:integrase, catalytic region, zinc finger, CCHC-type, peptidase aspartic, catalytic [Tanacetum cinerariifolium]
EKVLVITAPKVQLNKLKGKAVLTEAISLNPIDPELQKVDAAPLVPKLRKNRTAHTDYIRQTQEEAATLREIVKSERLLRPLNTSLVYALPSREPIPIVNSTDKPVVTLVYSRKPKSKKVSNKMEPKNSWGSLSSNVPSSLFACRLSKLSSGQFCDSDLEVAFRQHTCFIRNLDAVDLLTGSRGNNRKTKAANKKVPVCNSMISKSLVANKLEHNNSWGSSSSNVPSLLIDCSENLGKLQPKANIGILIGYAPKKKAFRIYNRHTKRIVETIHVDFDELTAMASEQSSSGPTLNEMTPRTISSGLVQKSSPSTSYVPPSRND